MTVSASGSPLLSCCDRSRITPDSFSTQWVFGKVKQLIDITVLTDRPRLTLFSGEVRMQQFGGDELMPAVSDLAVEELLSASSYGSSGSAC